MSAFEEGSQSGPKASFIVKNEGQGRTCGCQWEARSDKISLSENSSERGHHSGFWLIVQCLLGHYSPVIIRRRGLSALVSASSSRSK